MALSGGCDLSLLHSAASWRKSRSSGADLGDHNGNITARLSIITVVC